MGRKKKGELIPISGRAQSSESLTSEPIQPPLIQLSDTEIAEAQVRLPKLIGDLEEMKVAHAGRRADMKAERKELQEQINNLAQQLRDRGR